MSWFRCIIGFSSENPLAVDVLTSPESSWNLQKSTFILLFLHYEPNWVRKGYFRSGLRFWDCLITRWLETMSILIVIERIYRYQHKSNYVKKNHSFVTFFVFLVSTLILPCSETKMSLIGQVFLKLYTPKDMLIQKHNRACFWKPFGSERVNESQKLLKSAKKYLYPTFSSFWAILSMEKLFSIRSEILLLLDNTLTGNYEYSCSNAENLSLPIQIQLYKNL